MRNQAHIVPRWLPYFILFCLLNTFSYYNGQAPNQGPRRVLFHTQPDVLFLTLQEEMALNSPSPPDTEEEEQEEEDLRCTRRLQERRMGHRRTAGLRWGKCNYREECK